MRLLDVGSCFNPFLKFDEFLTVGIDIVPAVEVRFMIHSVHLCLFCFKLLMTRMKYVIFSCHLEVCQHHKAKTTPELCPAGVFVVLFSGLCKQFQQKAEQKAPHIRQPEKLNGVTMAIGAKQQMIRFEPQYLLIFYPSCSFLECVQVRLPQPSAPAATPAGR